MFKNYAFAALAAVPACIAPAMATDLSTPEGVFDEQMALLDAFVTILTSNDTPEQMAQSIDMLVPRAKDLTEAGKNVDQKRLEQLAVEHKDMMEQMAMKLMAGVLKISMDPAYATSKELERAVKAFMGAAGGDISIEVEAADEAMPGVPMQ